MNIARICGALLILSITFIHGCSDKRQVSQRPNQQVRIIAFKDPSENQISVNSLGRQKPGKKAGVAE